MRHDSLDIPFSTHLLDNGLQLIVHEDHACPLVSVNIWYHVGSKNETPGRSGFAHLFEHLMFEASEHFGKSYFEILQKAGGQINGSTNTDRTNYWEVVPTNALELALWMESDRMGHMLSALTQHTFDTQREVVLNERRQNYENRPYGMALVALVAALFPADHPYSWITIGAPSDLRASTLAEVRAFFQRHYHPANASLAVAGDVDPDEVVRLVRGGFGHIPGKAPAARVAPAPRHATPSRRLIEDRVDLPRLYMAWLTPAMYADGDADLDMVADVLAGGKPSRLYRRLVYEQRIATDVTAYQNSREMGSFFVVAATAVPGVGLDRIEAAVAEELAACVADGPTEDELAMTLAMTESAFVSRLEHVGGFGGKADQLNRYHVFLRDPGFFGRDLARYRSVTRASLQEAAGRFLGPAHRVTLSVVPGGRRDLAAGEAELVVVS